jgi:hypothetical protein
LWLGSHHHRADLGAWLLLALWGAVTVVAAVCCWAAPRAILRRIEVGRRPLAVATYALGGVAACMWAVAIATAVYLVALLADTPALAASGQGPGAFSVTDIDIALQLAVMLAFAAVAALSAARGARALRAS